MQRMDCLRHLAGALDEQDLAVAALGFTTTAWYHLRGPERSVFTSGMGGNTGLAIGLALALPHRRVVLVDTDGCQLMALHALCTLAGVAPANLAVFVFDNERYGATGGQPTATAGRADLAALARAAGVPDVAQVEALDAFEARCDGVLGSGSLSYTVAKVAPDERIEFRERFDRVEAKYRFVRSVEADEQIMIIPDERGPFVRKR